MLIRKSKKTTLAICSYLISQFVKMTTENMHLFGNIFPANYLEPHMFECNRVRESFDFEPLRSASNYSLDLSYTVYANCIKRKSILLQLIIYSATHLNIKDIFDPHEHHMRKTHYGKMPNN